MESVEAAEFEAVVLVQVAEVSLLQLVQLCEGIPEQQMWARKHESVGVGPLDTDQHQNQVLDCG